MRRIQLPNASDDGWSYDPSSIEEVIEARLRRQEIEERRLRELMRANGAKASAKRGVLGLNGSELDSIRHEATRKFFNSATLSEDLRQERQRYREHFAVRVERFLKHPERELSHAADVLAVMFATPCEKAISRAAGDFADLLTQAAITRRGRKDFSRGFRTEMWKECLQFAINLAKWENAGFWVELAWGRDPQENILPQLYKLESIKDQQSVIEEFGKRFRPQFVERVKHASPEWLDEAERKIRLRCVLSGSPQRRVKFDDPSKQAVALLLTVSPELDTGQVCGRLDAQNERRPDSAPVPKTWRQNAARSWIEAYEKFPGRVKTYISTVRRAYGIAKSASQNG